jgi:hypothetical protein
MRFCHFYARKGLTWRERSTAESPMILLIGFSVSAAGASSLMGNLYRVTFVSSWLAPQKAHSLGAGLRKRLLTASADILVMLRALDLSVLHRRR